MLNRFLNLLNNPKIDAPPQVKNALRISLIGLLATVTSAVIYLVLAIQSGAWQLYAWSASIWALVLAILIGIPLNRRGSVAASTWILLITLHSTSIFTTTIIDGVGIPLGITGAILSIIIAGQTLSTKQFNWAVAVSAISGIGTMLLELYLPAGRFLQPPFIRVYLPATIVFVLLLFGYLTFQQFTQYLLRTKLTIIFITIVFLSVGLVASISSVVLQANLTRDIGNQLYTIARSKATEIGQVIKRESNTLSALTYNKLVQQTASEANEKDPLTQNEIDLLDGQWQAGANEQLINNVITNELGNELRRFQEQFPQHSEIFLTNRQGINIAATGRTSDYYQADEEWWILAFREGLFIGQPEYDESSDTISIVVAARVLDPDTGDVTGVLRTTVALTSLVDSLASGLFGETGHVDIYLPRGQEIQLELGQNGNYEVVLTDAEIDITPFISLPDRYLEITVDNVPIIASEYPVRANADDTNDDDLTISNLSWRVLALQDQSEAFAAIETQTRNNILLTIIISIMVALAALGMSQVIAAPVSRLTAVANQIAAGDLSSQAQVETGDEIGILAGTLNKMTSQIRDLVSTLEQRVSERTSDLEQANQHNEKRARQFEAVAQVARAITANESIDTLLHKLTTLISDNFGFYHVGIFLLDEDHKNAVLRATNSPGGKRMLARKHKLQVGQTGIVGFVSATGTPRIALDVGTDAVFFNNPDLPDTHSEMALPLRVAGEIIGVLDVQSTETNAFEQDDIEVLSTLADQVSIAIQNAESFETMQQLLQEAQRTSSSFLKDAWHDEQQSGTSHIGYRAYGEEIQVYNKPLTSAHIKKAVEAKQTVIENGKSASLAIPIRLRDEVIGIVDIRTPSEHEWDEDEVDIAEAVADRLSLALETSLLLSTTQKRAQFERVTAEISGKIGATTQFDAILRTAAEELSRVLGGSDVLVQLQSLDTPNGSEN